jgi:hypothetical protein
VDQKGAHTPHLPSLSDAAGNPAQPTPAGSVPPSRRHFGHAQARGRRQQ